jgi:predicted RNA-binding Zn-ribbon protein involved in translation (DUF1610 family)
MDAPASSPEVRESVDDRANELYWGSDLSVNQIAETLDLSKGALYEMIRPLAAAVACPDCGTEAVHPNRTAHERGLVVCLSCGWEGDDEQAVMLPTLPPDESAEPRSERTRVWPGLTVPIVIGAAVGMAVVLWALRRK